MYSTVNKLMSGDNFQYNIDLFYTSITKLMASLYLNYLKMFTFQFYL